MPNTLRATTTHHIVFELIFYPWTTQLQHKIIWCGTAKINFVSYLCFYRISKTLEFLWMAVVLSGERRMATWECTLSQVSLKMLGRPYAVKIGPGGLRATTEVACINDRSNRPGSTLLGSTANYRAFHKKLLSRKWNYFLLLYFSAS